VVRQISNADQKLKAEVEFRGGERKWLVLAIAPLELL
jgi:hypothetical protein